MSEKITCVRQSIKDWPENERPRERLLLFGPKTLSNAELLAIFLRTGIQGKSARDLAQELLNQFGGLRGLYSVEDKELGKVKGLGPAKIAQLRAAIELSNRYLAEALKDKPILNQPKLIYEYLLHSMRDLPQEEFKILLLNQKLHLIEQIDAFKGTLTQSSIYPREIIKLALRYGAASLVFVHNHPSGDPQPSKPDRALTRELILACQSVQVKVADHIIIGNNCYFSFSEAGLINKYQHQVAQAMEVQEL